MSGPEVLLLRLKVILESTSPTLPGQKPYVFTFTSWEGAKLVVGSDVLFEGAPSGLTAIHTSEALEGQSGTLQFGWSPLSQKLAELVRPNDHLRIEFGYSGEGELRLAHDGFVSSRKRQRQAEARGVRFGLTIAAEGFKKLFSQAVYNWQGALGLGSAVADGIKQAYPAYQELVKDGLFKAPHEIIKAFVTIALGLDGKSGPTIQLATAAGPVKDGFGFGTWKSYYKGTWPYSAERVLTTWSGSYWELLQGLAEPDLHELFLVYGGDPGQEGHRLVHRPRPFPAGGDTDDWNALPTLTLGQDGAPSALALMDEVSDASRVNAFHWGAGCFVDGFPSALFYKMDLGWQADQIGMDRYGFAPRQVRSNLNPAQGSNYQKLINEVLKRVALQEAPLHLLGHQSRQYDRPIPGARPGTRVEDSSFGSPTTAYLTTVSHSFQWTEEGLRAATTLGLARAMDGVKVAGYAGAVASLVNVQPKQYQDRGDEKAPHQKAMEAHETGRDPEPSRDKGGAGASGVPYAKEMAAAAARNGVPAWLVAETARKESSLGRNPNYKKVNGTGDLGFMQLNTGPSGALADLQARGYKNQDGTPITKDDLLDDKKSIDAGAAYLKVCKDAIKAKGCSESDPNFWRYVSDAYNRGPGTAGNAGQSNGWTNAGLSPYGSAVDVSKAQGAFGGLSRG